jgi:hypothetical protein
MTFDALLLLPQALVLLIYSHEQRRDCNNMRQSRNDHMTTSQHDLCISLNIIRFGHHYYTRSSLTRHRQKDAFLHFLEKSSYQLCVGGLFADALRLVPRRRGGG